MKRAKRVSVSTLSGLIFGVVGLLFLGIVQVVNLTNQGFMNHADKTRAIITSIQSHRTSGRVRHLSHTVMVSYKVDGVQYEEKLGEWDDSMNEGDPITIYYNLENPKDIRTGDNWSKLRIIFTVVGIILVALAILMISKGIKKGRRNKQILTTGRKVYATVTNVIVDCRTIIMNRHPAYVDCIYRDEFTNETFTYRSDRVMSYNHIAPGNMVEVYMNPDNREEHSARIHIHSLCISQPQECVEHTFLPLLFYLY